MDIKIKQEPIELLKYVVRKINAVMAEHSDEVTYYISPYSDKKLEFEYFSKKNGRIVSSDYFLSGFRLKVGYGVKIEYISKNEERGSYKKQLADIQKEDSNVKYLLEVVKSRNIKMPLTDLCSIERKTKDYVVQRIDCQSYYHIVPNKDNANSIIIDMINFMHLKKRRK